MPGRGGAYYQEERAAICPYVHPFIRPSVQAITPVTPEQLTAFQKVLLDRVFFETFLHGNSTEKEALELVDVIEKTISPRSAWRRLLLLLLPLLLRPPACWLLLAVRGNE